MTKEDLYIFLILIGVGLIATVVKAVIRYYKMRNEIDDMFKEYDD